MTQRQGQEGGGKNVLFGIDTSDLLLSTVQDVGEYAGYPRTLGALAPLLTARYGTGRLQAAIHERPQETTMRFAQFGFEVDTEHYLLSRQDGVCMAMELTEDEFLLVACGCVIVPFSNCKERPHTDLLCVEEGTYENGCWKMNRSMRLQNGRTRMI